MTYRAYISKRIEESRSKTGLDREEKNDPASVDIVNSLVNQQPPRLQSLRAQELCESRGSRPGLPVPNSPYGRLAEPEGSP